MPSVTFAIGSVLFGISYKYLTDPFLRGDVFLFGALFTISLTIALTKHRLFMDERTLVLKKIENQWHKKNSNIRLIKRMTSDIPAKRKNFFHNLIAYHWLLGSMIIAFIALFGLSIYNFLIGMKLICIVYNIK